MTTSSVELDPNSLEWTERELRRQVRSLLCEVEAREEAKDQERREHEALEEARLTSESTRTARRGGSSRRKRRSSTSGVSRRSSGSARASARRSGSTRARTSGVGRTRSRSGPGWIWAVAGSLAVGSLGLLVLLAS